MRLFYQGIRGIESSIIRLFSGLDKMRQDIENSYQLALQLNNDLREIEGIQILVEFLVILSIYCEISRFLAYSRWD